MKKLPIIGITMGDPKGIGPEVIQKSLASREFRGLFQALLFGDPAYFDYKKAKHLSPKECGQLSGFYIEQAAQAVMQGKIDAVVTAPISKENLQKGGYPYPGHTEFLADLAQVKDFRMMMAGPKLKVVLVTIHEPIKKVAALLNTASIVTTIRVTHDSLKKWLGKNPRIAVAALNPHAGEGGIFGDEEQKIILPAILKAKKEKIQVEGPFSPDTVFLRAVQGEFDVVIAMYHDQGLIPLKILHFDEGVNITLGLPFIRTSVDHGTAFDIAGKGIADATSMKAAIKMALEMVKK
ncbi:MAG: 4-hydroxythreonine-4-phosphate dehydrogenase PdxA [Deltaproteobacteria bacterium]|nr:4-hydroxythreonine-4-phosphate dehydrogenase PdxA [Deltaproteobacteria bacterium]